LLDCCHGDRAIAPKRLVRELQCAAILAHSLENDGWFGLQSQAGVLQRFPILPDRYRTDALVIALLRAGKLQHAAVAFQRHQQCVVIDSAMVHGSFRDRWR
jgi:hypothetical protein